MIRTYIYQSLLIWFLTIVTGSATLAIIFMSVTVLLYSLGWSALLSLHTLILLVPTLYILDGIDGAAKRIFFCIISTLTICSIVLSCYLFMLRGTPAQDFMLLFLPYIVAAPVCLIAVAEGAMALKMKSTND